MAALVTELDPDQPQVLLIGQDEWWRRRIKSALSRRRLSVVARTLSDVLNQPDFLFNHSWYKVVLLADSTAPGSHVSQLEQFFTQASSLNTTLLVVHRVVTPVATTLPETGVWRQRSQLDRTLLSLAESSLSGLPSTGSAKSALVAVENLIPPDSARWLPFQYCIQRLDQQLLLDPNLALPLTPADTAVDALVATILTPQPASRLMLAGRERSTSSLVQEIARHYFHLSGKQLERRRLGLEKAEPLWSDWQLQRASSPSLPDLLTPSIRQLPQDEHHLAAFLAGIKPVSPSQVITDKVTEVANVSFSPDNAVSPSKQSITGAAASSERIMINSLQPSVDVDGDAEHETGDDNLGEADQPLPTAQKMELTIESLFNQYRLDHKLARVTQLAQHTKQTRRKHSKRRAFFWSGLGVVGVGVAVLTAAAVFMLSTAMLRRALWSELNNPLPSSRLQQHLSLVQWQYRLYQSLLPAPLWGDVPVLIELSEEVVALPQVTTEFDRHRAEVVTGLVQNGALQVLAQQNDAFDAQASYGQLSDLISRFKDVEPPNNATQQELEERPLLTTINQLRGNLVLYQQLQPNLPNLIGADGRQVYGLVIQNNQELRPGGGFIEAIGTITLDQGRLIDTRVWPVQQLEEQFGGQVTPPPELAALLGVSNWRLRDANWPADFRQAGEQVTFFLEQSMRQEVAGVIGLNQRSLSRLIAAVGPLEIDQLNQTITADNLAERWYQHTQLTSQPSLFAEAVTAQLLDAIQQLDDQTALELLGALRQALRSQQLMVYLDDPNLEMTMNVLGWSGEVVTPECPSRLATVNCVVDTIAVVEANVGVNKANHLTTRRDSHTIRLSPTAAEHTRQIVLRNDSSANAWPQGVYRAYFTAILPRRVEGVAVEVDGQALSPNQLQIQVGDAEARVSFVLTVPLEADRDITLQYRTPLDDVEPDKAFSYVFFNQQQPGVDDVLAAVRLVHDPALSPRLILPAAEVETDSLFFDVLPPGHSLVGGEFAHKP